MKPLSMTEEDADFPLNKQLVRKPGEHFWVAWTHDSLRQGWATLVSIRATIMLLCPEGQMSQTKTYSL